jgi:hypothetical protein
MQTTAGGAAQIACNRSSLEIPKGITRTSMPGSSCANIWQASSSAASFAGRQITLAALRFSDGAESAPDPISSTNSRLFS